MSFSLTEEQFKARTKTVTRRLAWWKLTPGKQLQGVRKRMGLKRGEKIQPLGVIEVVATTAERLDAITAEECALEGFPDMTPAEFVDFFCSANRCKPSTIVNRIEFRYVDPISPEPTQYRDCPTCEGVGTVPDPDYPLLNAECSDCEGEGKVDRQGFAPSYSE